MEALGANMHAWSYANSVSDELVARDGADLSITPLDESISKVNFCDLLLSKPFHPDTRFSRHMLEDGTIVTRDINAAEVRLVLLDLAQRGYKASSPERFQFLMHAHVL